MIFKPHCFYSSWCCNCEAFCSHCLTIVEKFREWWQVKMEQGRKVSYCSTEWCRFGINLSSQFSPVMPLSLKPQSKVFIAELVYVPPVTPLCLARHSMGSLAGGLGSLLGVHGEVWEAGGRLGCPMPETVPISSSHTRDLSCCGVWVLYPSSICYLNRSHSAYSFILSGRVQIKFSPARNNHG